VHENETSTKVSAIKNIPEKLLRPALESTLFVQEAGNVISKAPRKEIPNRRNNKKTKILKTALLDIWYKVSLPNAIVSSKPSSVNITTMETEYNVAFFIPWALVLLLFRKNETVTGNIAYKQGCRTEIKPQRKPSRKVPINDLGAILIWFVVSVWAKAMKAEIQNKAARKNFNLFIIKAR
jgi:hypothetical protein